MCTERLVVVRSPHTLEEWFAAFVFSKENVLCLTCQSTTRADLST